VKGKGSEILTCLTSALLETAHNFGRDGGWRNNLHSCF